MVGSAQTSDWQPEPASPLLGVRALAVVMGGPLVLLAAAIASAGVSLRALVRREAPPPLAAAGVGASVAYARVFRPWMKTWGTRPGEAAKALPGDETVPDPGLEQTRAIPVARWRSNGGTWPLSRTAPAARGSTHAHGRHAAPPHLATSCSSSSRTS